MNPNTLIAAISAGGTVLVAIAALILNYRGFNSIEHRLGVIEADLKEFYKHLSRVDTDIARLKDKTGLP